MNQYFNTVCYAVIFVACCTHLNRIHGLTLIRAAAFALTAAGAVGGAVEPWGAHPHAHAVWWHTMFNLGVAVIAVIHFGIDRRKPSCPPVMPAECMTSMERRFRSSP